MDRGDLLSVSVSGFSRTCGLEAAEICKSEYISDVG